MTSSSAALVLALPTRLHAWFHDTPRTDDLTLESWANPATIDLGNLLTLLPMLAFLAALATLLLAVLALRWPLAGLVGAGTALTTVLAMMLAWVLLGAYASVVLPSLLLVPAAGTLLLTVAVLHLVEAQRARVDARA